MKAIFVLLILVSTSFTAQANNLNQFSLEKALSQTFHQDVKIINVRHSRSPLDWFVNSLDNSDIRKVKLVVNQQHEVKCDLYIFENENKVRLDNCNSKTAQVSDGYFYF